VRLDVTAKGLELTTAQEKLLRRHVDRLETRLAQFDPDLVDLELTLEKQARREEYACHARLVVMNRALPSRRGVARTLAMLLGKVFEDLEEEAAKLLSEIRGDAAWRRKRHGSRDAAKIADDARRLTEERALLDQALAGERASFDRLAEAQLAGVRSVIFDVLSAGGHRPTDDALDQALSLTLSRAFERLAQKPEPWSLHGWLAWTARRELEAAVHT
jgi:hypothetical protein